MRFGIESVVIVGSILLAFAIDAGWERAQERNQERALLDDLEQEYTRLQAELVRRIGRNNNIVAELTTLLEVGSGGTVPPVDELDRAFRALIVAPTWDPQQSVTETLFSSGLIDVIGSDELRATLALWNGRVEELRDNETEIRLAMREQLLPYLVERGHPMLGRGIPEGWQAPVPTDAEAGEIYVRLFREAGFRVLVEYRLDWQLNTRGEFTRVANLADTIVALVQERRTALH